MEAKLGDTTAERILEHLYDIDYYSEEAIVPYWKFSMDGYTYYLTCGGFLYREEPGTEGGVGGFSCGSFVDGVFWSPRTDHG